MQEPTTPEAAQEPTMASLEDDHIWMVLVGIFVIVDSWKTYLTLRNIWSLKKSPGPPPELEMGALEFDRMRETMVVESTYILLFTMLGLGSRIAKLMFNYYPYIWALSADYGKTMTTRAMWFSALDVFIDRGKFIPIAFLAAVVTGGVDPFLVVVNIVISTGVSALGQALGTYVAIILTEWFGPSGILKLSLITNFIGLFAVAFYIKWMVPMTFQRLPNDEAGRSITALATSVGYPIELIYVDSTDALPNAFYSNALFSKMIIITQSLITSLDAPQLTSVVAHELGHWKYRHPFFTFLESLLEVLGRGTLWMVSYGNARFTNFFQLESDVHPIIPVLLTDSFIRPPFTDVLRGIFKVFNAHFEFVADDFACRVWNAGHLRAALVKMSNKPRSFPVLDSWFSAWFFGHPTTLDRIRRIDSHQQRNYNRIISQAASR